MTVIFTSVPACLKLSSFCSTTFPKDLNPEDRSPHLAEDPASHPVRLRWGRRRKAMEKRPARMSRLCAAIAIGGVVPRGPCKRTLVSSTRPLDCAIFRSWFMRARSCVATSSSKSSPINSSGSRPTSGPNAHRRTQSSDRPLIPPKRPPNKTQTRHNGRARSAASNFQTIAFASVLSNLLSTLDWPLRLSFAPANSQMEQ